MNTANKNSYEVVLGTRVSPGAVLKSFSGSFKCGGPATACLRWFDRESRKPNAPEMFFRRAGVVS